MSSALNGRSAVRRFEGNDAIEIRYGITFDFYMRLPQLYFLLFISQSVLHTGLLLIFYLVTLYTQYMNQPHEDLKENMS